MQFLCYETQLFQRTGGRPFDVRAVEGAGWDRRPPRPYECRHSFCTHTIERWVAEGRDVNAMMPILSAYVGHSKVADTYWYLTATDALLDAASDMFWASVGGGRRG